MTSGVTKPLHTGSPRPSLTQTAAESMAEALGASCMHACVEENASARVRTDNLIWLKQFGVASI